MTFLQACFLNGLHERHKCRFYISSSKHNIQGTSFVLEWSHSKWALNNYGNVAQ